MLEKIRLRLAGTESGLPYIAALGLLSGLLAGAVILAFRFVIEAGQALLLPGGVQENYEALTPLAIFLLPAIGGLVIGLVYQFIPREKRSVGVVHVIERLSYYQGQLPLSNAVVQFCGAALSIITGHSVGREGPAVHLGAAAASQLGHHLGLPNNSVRILVGCGVAAAIGASFNTPLSGVVFAMEVVVLEYTIVGFIPVILASVAATALTRLVYGQSPAFAVPPIELTSITELPWVLITGIVMGVLAAAFIHLLVRFSQLGVNWPIWLRITLGSLISAAVGVAVPQVMGVGYDTVNSALLGEFTVGMLLALTAAKILATTAAVGLGVPGGIIGPTLVVGAAAGGALGVMADNWYPGPTAGAGFYALVGMGAMMGATLQAPLAALMAMLELTANPHIILPGMLAVVAAGLIAREIFGQRSIFLVLLRLRGLDYEHSPVAQALRSVGVASAMDRDFVIAPLIQSREELEKCLTHKPRWIVIEDDGKRVLLRAADLARYMLESDEKRIDLAGIPGERLDTAPIPFHATLQEAYDLLSRIQGDALYVERKRRNQKPYIYGVLTREDVEAYRTGL